MIDKRLYLRQWLLALDRFEHRAFGKVGVNRNAFIAAAAKSYEASGSVPTHVRTKHEAKLGEILFAHYGLVIPYFGTLATKKIKSTHHVIEKKRDTFLTNLMEWARTRALNNASTIADTDLADVRSAIANGLDAGLGTEEIARAIRSVTSSTPYRAATVARTETHAAATYGAIEEARQTSDEIGIVLVKQWLPTSDERTRPEHAAMEAAEAIPLNQMFEVGGELLDRPGDPSGSPENVINCRCAIITEEAPT